MKKLTTLFLVAFSGVMLAQTVPNACLESWSSPPNASPNLWESSNIIVPGSVTASSAPPHGACTPYCAELSAVDSGHGVYFGGGLVTFSISGLHATLYFKNTSTSNPVAFNGWYQLAAVGGDVLEVTGGSKTAYNHNNSFAIAVYGTNTAVWKAFSACFVYDSATADSIVLGASLLSSAYKDTGLHLGTIGYLSDLSFGACAAAGVAEVSNNNVTIEEAYPNPASGICNIIFSLPCSSTVNVAIYDLSGRKVLTPLENATLTDGRYKVPVDVTGLVNGIYEYTLTVNGMPYTQKLVVTK